jgi:hypothetical protein
MGKGSEVVSVESLGHQTGNVAFETWWSMKELARKVILDLGCMRNVVGIDWANDVIKEWQQQGRWLRVLPEEETFRFGDGNTLRSKYRLQLESTFGGKRVLLAFSVVPGPCPPLLSKQSHTALGVQLDTEKHVLTSRKLKIKSYGLSENNAGHYTVRIDEFHLLDVWTWMNARVGRWTHMQKWPCLMNFVNAKFLAHKWIKTVGPPSLR